MLREALLGGSAAFTLLVAPAGAATLTTDGSCYRTSTQITATGQGFAPGAPVTVQGRGVFGSATADAAGSFQVPLRSPVLPYIGPGARTVTLTASDGTNTGQARIRVTNFAVRSQPRSPSRPGQQVRWVISGFAPGARVWAHYVHGGRQQARVALGRMPKGCGTLRHRLRLIPLSNPAYGRWTIQFDTHKRYSRSTKDKLSISGRIYRRVG